MKRFDQFIDMVAFGQQKPKFGACLGLYLSLEAIFIAETHTGKGGKLAVDHLVRIPVPQAKGEATDTMAMNTDFLADPIEVAGLISRSMAQIHWNSKNVVVTLSHHLGLLRFFPMPTMEKRFLRSAVPLEAKKYIPIPFDALAYDFQAAPMPPDVSGKARQGILISVGQEKNLANVSGLVQVLGLNLVGVEVAPCSVLRLWQAVEPAQGSKPFVQIHFDEGSVRILICERGLPVFFREIFFDGEATLADQRKVDLSGCLAFAQEHLALSGLSKIKLSGTPTILGLWKEALALETGLSAEISDTAQLLSIKGGDWGSYAALGASARMLAPSAVTLDLTFVNRISDEERQTARDILIGGALLAALIAGVGLFQTMTYRYRTRGLNAYKVDTDIKAVLGGLPPSEIESKLKEMREQLGSVRSVAGAWRPRISAVLRDIVELMPDNVWLSKISATNPLIADKAGLEIVLNGRTRGASVSEEQDLAFRFKDTLLRSEKIGKFFDIQISVQGQSSVPAQTGAVGLDPKALAKKLEERTEFVLALKAKQYGP